MKITKNNNTVLVTCESTDFVQIDNIWRATITGINRFIYQYYTCRVKVYNRASSLDDKVTINIPTITTTTINAIENQRWYNINGFDDNRLTLGTTTIYIDIYFNPNATYGGSKVDIEFSTDNSVIYCFNNNVEDIKVFKPIVNLFHLTGIFRDNIDLINPTFEIEYPEIPTFNYVFLNMFGRYYFVDSIECIRNNLYRIYCSIDILMSYKEQLPNLEVYVTRQANKYNDLMPDPKLPAIIKHDLKSWHLKLKSGSTFFNAFAQNAKLRYSFSCISPYYGSNNAFPNTDSNVLYIGDAYAVNSLLWALNNLGWTDSLKYLFSDIRDTVKNITLFPFEISTKYLTKQENLRIFNTNIPNEQEIKTKAFSSDLGYESSRFMNFSNMYTMDRIFIEEITYYVDDFDLNTDRFEFLKYNPYSSITLYLPFYGSIDIDLELVLDKYFEVKYRVSLYDGDTSIEVGSYNDSSKLEINKLTYYHTRIGCNIPITSGNANEILRNYLLNGLKNSANIATGMLVSKLDIEQANIGNMRQKGVRRNKKELAADKFAIKEAKASGVIRTINNVTDVVCDSLTPTNVQLTGDRNSGGLIDFNEYSDPVLFIKKLKLPDSFHMGRYAQIVGRPCSYYSRLGDLTGYTECGAFHLEGINGITTDERDLLENILRSGIIM